MLPSGRSDSTHTRTGLCPVLAVPGPSQTHRLRGRLRSYLAGSPVALAVSSSLSFRTNLPLPAAPHPALPRRSCLPLPQACCLPEGNDFHILSSWFHGRTRWPRRGRDWTDRSRLRGPIATRDANPRGVADPVAQTSRNEEVRLIPRCALDRWRASLRRRRLRVAFT